MKMIHPITTNGRLVCTDTGSDSLRTNASNRAVVIGSMSLMVIVEEASKNVILQLLQSVPTRWPRAGRWRLTPLVGALFWTACFIIRRQRPICDDVARHAQTRPGIQGTCFCEVVKKLFVER